MDITLVVLSLITIYYIVFFIKFNKITNVSLIKKENLVHILYNHGYKTLQNGIRNIRAFLICYWLTVLNVLFLNNYLSHDEVPFYKNLFLFIMFLSVLNYLYIFSEIKHLSDGISKTKESHIFYLKYSLLGIVGFISDLIILTFFETSIKTKLLLIVSFILFFIMGMGDLLQVRNINVFGTKKKDAFEPIYLLIDVSTQIIKAIIFTEHRNTFTKTLVFNFENIKKGLYKAILILRNKEIDAAL